MHRHLGPVLVSVPAIGLFGFALWYLLNRQVPESGVELLSALIGALAAKFSTIVDYWVGSSAGSADKNLLLGKIPP